MAIKRSKVQWILGFVFILLLLALVEWLEFHYNHIHYKVNTPTIGIHENL